MRLYFLVEGRHTEKRLYQAWLGHCFPQLKPVVQPADLRADTFFLVSGMGYPSYLQRIPEALENSVRHGVDHLFICIDSEEHTYEARYQEVRGIMDQSAESLRQRGLAYGGQAHVIVADCCLETWLLGHRRLIPRQPSSARLAEYKRFHDTSVRDPELMGCPSGNPLERAGFHFEYLREVFRHHGQTYSKKLPGMALEANYLAALRDRCLDPAQTPPHLASFRKLWDTWALLGARYQVEAAPPQ